MGGSKKVKPASEPCVYGVDTLTIPVAPDPTMALIVVADIMVKPVAGIPPKLTEVAAEKLRPVIVMLPPAPEIVGEKEVIITGG